MKVKMLSTMAGPTGAYQAGEIADLPEEEAKSLVAQGYARLPATGIHNTRGWSSAHWIGRKAPSKVFSAGQLERLEQLISAPTASDENPAHCRTEFVGKKVHVRESDQQIIGMKNVIGIRHQCPIWLLTEITSEFIARRSNEDGHPGMPTHKEVGKNLKALESTVSAVAKQLEKSKLTKSLNDLALTVSNLDQMSDQRLFTSHWFKMHNALAFRIPSTPLQRWLGRKAAGEHTNGAFVCPEESLRQVRCHLPYRPSLEVQEELKNINSTIIKPLNNAVDQASHLPFLLKRLLESIDWALDDHKKESAEQSRRPPNYAADEMAQRVAALLESVGVEPKLARLNKDKKSMPPTYRGPGPSPYLEILQIVLATARDNHSVDYSNEAHNLGSKALKARKRLNKSRKP